MLSRVVASTKPLLASRLHGLAAGADAVAHATAGAAVLGVLESGAAVRDAARGEAVRPVRRGLRIGGDRLSERARPPGRPPEYPPRGRPSRRPLDHRPSGPAAGIVRIGEPRPAAVLEGVGADVALRQVGPGIARHRPGLRGVAGDRARRRGPRVADRPCRRLCRRLCRRPLPPDTSDPAPPASEAGAWLPHDPQRQACASSAEDGDPGQEADDPQTCRLSSAPARAADVGTGARAHCKCPPTPSSPDPHQMTFEPGPRSLTTGIALFRDRFQRGHEPDVAGTMRSWGGAGSAAQPRLSQGGTPPGTTATAGTRVTPNRRNRRGSMATPALATPARPPRRATDFRLPVARKPSVCDPAHHQRCPDPCRIACDHCRQLAAGTDRLVNSRISAVFGRGPRFRASPRAWRSAGSGSGGPARQAPGNGLSWGLSVPPRRHVSAPGR